MVTKEDMRQDTRDGDQQEAATERENELLHIIRKSKHREKLISFALSLISQFEHERRKE